MKTIALLDAGGTISNYASNVSAEFYNEKGRSINTFLEEFSLHENLNVNYYYFCDKISHEFSFEEILNLAIKIQELVDNSKILSVIVSIGTNALEDIAFFIDLVVKTSKNIVFTGANFPQNNLGFDGKKNLYNALIIAQTKLSYNLGTVVTFNDTVVLAKWATKTNPGIVNNYSYQGMGIIGHVVGNTFYPIMQPVNRQSKINNLSIKAMKSFPKIAIIYAHLGMDIEYIEYIANNKNIQGIISAGYGKGYQNKEVNKLLSQIAKTNQIPVVRCARAGIAITNKDISHDEKYGFIVSSRLFPHKASILLSVCIAHRLSINEIQTVFEEY